MADTRATDPIRFGVARATSARAILRGCVVPQSPIELIHPRRTKPSHRDGWIYEEKYDGWRIDAYKDGPDVRLISRRGRDHTTRFPDVPLPSPGCRLGR